VTQWFNHLCIIRFYFLYYSYIFSCRKIMWDVYRLGDFTFCTIHVFSAKKYVFNTTH
jgi:hypothetical protein